MIEREIQSAVLMAEREIVAAVLAAITALPDVLAWRANSFLGVTASRQVVRANVPGCADIIACCRGKFYAIEVKTVTGRQSAVQRRFQRAVERAGGIYLIVTSPAYALAALA